ncbi:HDOD domain-containing protein [Thiovibrio frasassiensis]|uniref:HDOD domain-containing protein n=1 Tax=Thiovibrio frasassiensis TaxID=2984131 RepID=A0A9X4RM74_9BACT|nr:HDOD domain-containing protein [Thiovibrio frasassiensis]MDG4476484.1 HDOD domain-containing protein [Thiovibrio frasassiensis]
MTETSPPSSGKLAEIFTKMNMGELPAMSHNVQELIALTHSSQSAGYELSKVILKDYSLTNKVLQVVNSAFYSLGRPVNSISRAVTIIGFDAVRDLATGIALFEDFVKNGVEKEGISKLLTRSFLSALQARDLAVEKNLNIVPEEAFICALLHNLGKIIVCIYMPEISREIEEKVAGGMSEDAATRQVLEGLTFEQIGVEVATFWNLSDKVCASMNPNPPEPQNTYDALGYLKNVANFSNKLIEHVCEEKDIDGLLRQYGEMLSMNLEEAVERVNKTVDASEDISESIRYGLAKLKMRSRLRGLEEAVKAPKTARKKKDKSEKVSGGEEAVREKDNVLEELGIQELEELPTSPDKSINDFIHDITETLMGPFNLNDFYINLLEGLYRGIGFDRVLLAVISVQPTRRVLVGRFGLGDIDPAGIAKFEHDLAPSDYVIPKSLKACKDMAVPPNAPGAFPESLKFFVKDRTVYLFPICLDDKPIGLIYLDRKKGRPKLDSNRIKATRLFRDFAVMAIRKLRSRK